MRELSRRVESLEASIRARHPAARGGGCMLLGAAGSGRLAPVDFSRGGPGEPGPEPAGYRPQREDETADDYVAALEAAGVVVILA